MKLVMSLYTHTFTCDGHFCNGGPGGLFLTGAIFASYCFIDTDCVEFVVECYVMHFVTVLQVLVWLQLFEIRCARISWRFMFHLETCKRHL